MATNKSNYSIMNVREIIDTAFGNIDKNTVNFKLIQAVLFLLANQLRILQRRVHIAIPSEIFETKSSLMVTEVKIHGKKKKQPKVDQKMPKGKNKSGSSSSDKTSTEKSKGSTDKTSTSKSSTDKTAADDNLLDKTSVKKSRKEKDSAKTTADKTSSQSSGTGKAGSNMELRDGESKLADRHNILEDYVDNAEKVLRVIHQRADSREQPDESPTPMASLENIEIQQEKLLVVERVPSGSKEDKSRDTKISVVTQEEFRELVVVVEEIQERLKPIGMAEFPENAQLMAELRKTASLTDAMAALQLSARLEAAEKALGHLITIVTEVARNTPGITLDENTIMTLEGQLKSTQSEKGTKVKAKPSGKDIKKDQFIKPRQDYATIQPSKTEELKEYIPKLPNIGETCSNEESKIDCVTYKELDAAIRNICEEMMQKLQAVTTKNTANSQQALKIATSLERNLTNALKVCSRMNELENLVKAYAEQINIVDTGLSSQMTNYQEQLTQMQHELEIGMDTMAENLANLGGDTVAVTELNNCFTTLQIDLENMGYRQTSLQEIQLTLKTDLKNLWKQIEMLKDTKSDRDEVADALKDKAGIADLNGLVTLEQFDAVRGDLEKRIIASYQKFNNQEIVWQKAIDDLLRELSEKADLVQVLSLKDQIEKYFNELKNRMQIISDIVGEPKSATVTKKLFRDSSCLCCSTPATMDPEKPETIPALPKFDGDKKPNEVSNKTKTIGDGDYKKCYPGLSIPHYRDPRSHYCQRYCGGSHTLLPTTIPRTPPSTIITAIIKETSLDDKVREANYQNQKRPCLPCNVAITPEENSPTHNCRS